MDIRDAAARALATRNRSKKELKDYLLKKGFSCDDTDEVILAFEEAGYLSDSEYAQQFFRYGFRKGWGKSRIFRELSKRGVDSSLIDDAYDEHIESCMEENSPGDFFGSTETEYREYDRALAVAEKMCAGEHFDGGKVSEKFKARVARRLSSYGYESSVIYRVINNLDRTENFDD